MLAVLKGREWRGASRSGRDGGGGVRAPLPRGFCPLYSSGFKRMTYPLCF